jgi:hypothetical protein
MQAYIIIGGPHVRKSSVIRSLTGCFNRNARNIALVNGQHIQIYARVSSLQESKTTPQQFISEAQQYNCLYVVFSMWPHANPANPMLYPDAATYIQAFTAAHWQINKVAVLGQSSVPVPYPNQAFFPNSPTAPINLTAQAVRSHFGWL